MLRRLLSVFALAMLASACGGEADEFQVLESGQQLTVAREIGAQAGGVTLWLEQDLRPVDFEGRTIWKFHGRTDADLSNVFPFICDDRLAGVEQLGPRDFELFMEWRELEVLLAPRDFYLKLTTAEAAPRVVYATVKIKPRLRDFVGSSSLWIGTWLEPRTVGGLTSYVGTVTSTKSLRSLSVYNDIDTDPVVTRLTSTKWEFAWPNPTQMLSMPMSGTPLFFRAQLNTGATLTKQARVYVDVASLSMSTAAPY